MVVVVAATGVCCRVLLLHSVEAPSVFFRSSSSPKHDPWWLLYASSSRCRDTNLGVFFPPRRFASHVFFLPCVYLSFSSHFFTFQAVFIGAGGVGSTLPRPITAHGAHCSPALSRRWERWPMEALLTGHGFSVFSS